MLRKCHNCGKLVDAATSACPSCGHVKKHSPIYLYALLAICPGVVFGVLMLCTQTASNPPPSLEQASINSSEPNTTASAQSMSISAANAIPSPSPSPTPIGQQWHYNIETDKMGRGKEYDAWVLSTNTVEFDFPYRGAQRATLTLRSHPRYGKDVIVSIERGQFLCRSYSACSVLIRFDDEEPATYSAVGPADHSSTHLFIQGHSRFMGRLLKAKRVRISATVFQQGSPVFDFDISGLSLERYKADPNDRKGRK
jgi:hypothetical protein